MSKDPKSPGGGKKPHLSKKQARKILEEVAKRASRVIRLNPEQALFGSQRKFVQDKSPRKVACCSRRAGKSFGIAYGLIEAGFKHPRSTPLYVTMSRADAQNIVWPAAQKISDLFNLSLEFKKNTGDIVLPNGSTILLRGAGSRREIEKLRGPGYPAVVIDEAQVFSQKDMDYMIKEAIEPALLDYPGSWMACTGTPNAAKAGTFYDICTGAGGWSGWSKHHWTLLENEHIQDAAEWLEEKRIRENLSESDPYYRREYLGEWVKNADGLVFPFNPDLHCEEIFPAGIADDWGYVLGIDIGYHDPTAFVVLAYSQALGMVHVVESHKDTKLTSSMVALQIELFHKKYPLEKVVMDTQGIGIGYQKEIEQKYHLPIVAAQKGNKLAYTKLLTGDFRTRAIQIVYNGNEDLCDELSLLQWDSRALMGNRFEHDRKFPNHLCDALLYAWRECYHHNNAWEREAPRPGTKEYDDLIEEEIYQDLLLQLEGNGNEWWEDY